MTRGKHYFIAKHISYFLYSHYTKTFKPSYQKGIPVLMFHSIGDNIHPKDILGIRLKREKFATILELIKKLEIATLFASELNERRNRKSVALTFDDGYQDNLTEMLPLLEKHEMKATIFVSIGEIDGKNTLLYPLLNSNSLRKAAASPLIEIGYHSYYHQPIAQMDEKTQEELKKGLETFGKIGIKTESFSFPHGTVPASFQDFFKKMGIEKAFSSEKGYYHPQSSPYKIPRQEISRYSGLSEIKAKIEQRF